MMSLNVPPLEILGQSLLQIGHCRGRGSEVVILEYHAAVILDPNDKAKTCLVTDLDVTVSVATSGDDGEQALTIRRLGW